MAKSRIRVRKIKKSEILTVLVVIAIAIYVFLTGGYERLLNNDPDKTFMFSAEVTKVDKLENLKIHFIDVGQGDCIYIEFPDGKNMLVDSGDNKSSIEEDLDVYLKELNVTSISYVLATHQDADHVGNMDYVYENFDVDFSFRPYVKAEKFLPEDDIFNQGNSLSTTVTYGKYVQAIFDEQTEYAFFSNFTDFNNSAEFQGVEYKYEVDFLTPYLSNKDDYSKVDYEDPNDFSPILTVEYGGKSLMLTGDCETEMEAEFLANYNNKDIDILKVSHHGSGTSSTNAFLNVVKPEYAVIQVGEGNKYGHPHQQVLDRLVAKNAEIYRNDTQGNIVFEITSTGEIIITTEREANYSDNLIGGK